MSDFESNRTINLDATKTLRSAPKRLEVEDAFELKPESHGIGLAARFFLATATLLVLAIGAAVAITSLSAEQVAETTIRDALEKVPQIYSAWSAGRQNAVYTQVESLAEEPGTKAIFGDEIDAATRWDFLADEVSSILTKARTVYMFDRESLVLARSDRPEGEGIGQPFGMVPWVGNALSSGRGQTAIVREKDQLSFVASAPVFEPGSRNVVGVLAATFPFDDDDLENLADINRGHVGLLLDQARRGEEQIIELGRSSSGFGGQLFASTLITETELIDTVFVHHRRLGPLTLVAAGSEQLAMILPVLGSSGDTLAAVVVSRSKAEEMAPFLKIRRTMLVVGLAALLLAVPVCLVMGRTLAKPLEQLADAAVLIREGHRDVEIPAGGGGEIGLLAEGFRQMVAELRQKAELEGMLVGMRRELEETRSTQMGRAAEAIAAGEAPSAGEAFTNRFQLEEVLGKGGMATVYRARDTTLDEVVALKLLSEEIFGAGSEELEALKHETRITRKITHPNVIRVHDLGESGGRAFITMEYVPGVTLRKVMEHHGAMALAPGLQIVKQLCRGLRAVHQAGIVHRDLKPQNVMVLPSGVLKLMDFGISVANQPDAQTGSSAGTPMYMSPEQCSGTTVGPASDIYSFGVMMYELFIGQPPFQSRDLVTLLRAHLHEPPQPPRSIRADLPPRLEQLILSCLAKTAAERPSSVAEIYKALRGLES